MEEESDVASCDVQGAHADDESDQADDNRADNVPELEESVRWAIYDRGTVVRQDVPSPGTDRSSRQPPERTNRRTPMGERS